MNAQRDWHSEPEPANESIEIGQPDRALQQEQAGPMRITIYALGGLFILGVVLYGLNRPHPQGELTAAAPPQQSAGATTGAASKDEKQTQPPRPGQPRSGDKPANQPNGQGSAPK